MGRTRAWGDCPAARSRRQQADDADCDEMKGHSPITAVIRTDVRGTRITKDSKSSPRRLDLAMAAVMAHDRAKELAGKTFRVW